MVDLFIVAGEMSGDLHGSKLIEQLLEIKPDLKIGAVAGPKMRKLCIEEFFPMENLAVMGFIDVFFALPKIFKQFFAIRKKILDLRPKAVILIDYPGFNLRLERSLRKKGYKGKLIHYICPTVWAWGKKRIPLMAKHLDLLLTIFPFEKSCFAKTSLNVKYVGHPLTLPVEQFEPTHKYPGKILALFPGSRKTEIERNLPLQLKAARRLKELDPTLQIAISITQFPIDEPDVILVPAEDHYELMKTAHMAIATSGTVTLELALHGTPTVVNFAIKPLDCFLAQKIFRIHLPFYCISNLVVNQLVFPELFGPNLTEEQLFFWAHKLWTDEEARNSCLLGCLEVRKSLGVKRASKEAANCVLSTIAF
ncbi:MAG: lipid-A-disaccharide synthase [Chlamydiae bacterium CG10_big_fil_rev_8_21_14_0_10_42_34]|nr:MAG: lipid-A-disaccharide synthase [Chlamydiae bacterium CG10_big_fil_rev_8_21_14_0_10_42_34]